MARFVGLSINKGKGGGARKKAEPFTRATGITTDSSNHVTEVTLGDTKYTKMYYNNVGLVTGFNETISGSRKGWILEYDSEGLVTSIEQRIPPHPNPSYNLTASTTTITENATVTFNLSLFDITDGTFYWRAEGTNITTADFTGGAITGSVTTSGGSAQISLTTVEDVTIEGIESFEMKIYSDSGYTSLVATSPTVTITDTSTPTFSITASTTSITENATVTFDVTTNAPDGTTLYWKADGSNVTTSDFTGGAITGSVATSGGSAQISLTTAEDNTTEGGESFEMKIYSDSGYTSLLTTSPSVSITDTSISAGLFGFTTATFTALTQSYVGPNLSEARSLVSNATGDTSWINNTNYLNTNSGIVLWTVPRTKTYRIKAAGSRGGVNHDYTDWSTTQDTTGAIMQAEFSLTEGDKLAMVIGSQGGPGVGNANTGSQGGGGTFVWIGNSSEIGGNTLLLAAGGGSSACPKSQTSYKNGSENGQTSTYAIASAGDGGTSRRGTPGQNGNSGTRYGNDDYDGGAGAGWLNSQSSNEDGKRFNGGVDLDQSYTAYGGWGGGGGSNDSVRAEYVSSIGTYVPWAHGRAGGGGYSGGSGNYYNHCGSGGGSYCKSTGSNLSTSNGSFLTTGSEHSPVYSGSVGNLGAYNAGPGYVIITELN